jgi:hypothetical protein
MMSAMYEVPEGVVPALGFDTLELMAADDKNH